ncbi:hypothetical protein L596_014975 [Steinernema carpocapsae]|uniref:Uncharacterized protein n=1 Tax=Steinernema carpocapsae TaxID=34508 RepID=A0A4U5NEG7_STECR|nr:hypothetical protein L596_014975 [Steinernema carpocapsae]
MKMKRFAFVILSLSATAFAHGLDVYGHGAKGKYADYGSVYDEHKNGYYGGANDYGSKDKGGYSHGEEHHDKFSHNEGVAAYGQEDNHDKKDVAAQHADAASNYGKDAVSKTKGFFDFHFQQPQFHVEKFFSDEKHAKKYGADEHNKYGKEHDYGHHDASDYNKYGKGYGDYAHGDHKHDNGYHGYGKYGSKYGNEFDQHAGGEYDQGQAQHLRGPPWIWIWLR